MLSKATSRLYILRVCKYYGYSLQELTLLFDSLIMSLFTYAIEVWASAHYSKYLSHIDKFCKRALRYGYTSKYTPIMDVIKMKDRLLWDEITSDSANPLHEFLPAQRARSLRKRGHNYILPPVRTERFKRCFFNSVFLNLCSYLVLYIHNRLIYVGNCKSRSFVSGRVSSIIFLKSIKILLVLHCCLHYG